MKKILILLIILLSFSAQIKAELINKEIIPELISPSNAGTEFHLAFIPVYYDPLDNYNIASFYFSSSVNTKLRFRIPTTFIDTVIFLKAGIVSDLTIKAKFAIAESKPLNAPTPHETVYNDRGIIVTSDSPIICYAMLRLRNYTGGYLALPLNFWGNDYSVNTFKDYYNNIDISAPSTAIVIGAFDNTRVSFTLGGNDSTRIFLPDGDSIVAGEIVSRTISRGDIWVLYGKGRYNELTGSFIRSNKPVAVVSGNYCSQIPQGAQPCKYLIEQEIPTYAYSKRYYVTPVHKRTKGSFVKVLAAEPNSEVYLNDKLKGTIISTSGIENEGYLSFRVNQDNSPAVISSNKRINVVQYNTGNEDGIDKGFPFKMQVLSSDHFSNIIKFNIPSTKQSEYYNQNFINIVFKPDIQGGIPADMLLQEFIDGNVLTRTVREMTLNQSVPFPVKEEDGSTYHCLTLELPKEGNYIIKADNPIGVSIYGYTLSDTYASIANIKLINHVKNTDTLPPVFNYESSSKGNFAGVISDMPIQVGVRSNLAMIHLVDDSTFNYEFFYDDIIPGVNQHSNFSIRPINIALPAQAFIRAVDFAGNDTILKFTYSNIPEPPLISILDYNQKDHCMGNEYTVEFDVSGGAIHNSNTFHVMLGRINDESGLYPLKVASASGEKPRSMKFIVPFSMIADTNYYLFLVSTVPPVSSDTISSLTIHSIPNLTIQGYDRIFAGDVHTYSVPDSNLSYKWTALNGEIIGNDDENTVNIRWNSAGSGSAVLDYSNSSNCSQTRFKSVNLATETINEIEGPLNVCSKDEIIYNSFQSNGIFTWSVIGGEFIGGVNDYIIKIRWLDEGIGKIKLIYKNNENFMKILEKDVIISGLPERPSISRQGTVLSSSSDSGNQWFFNGNLIPGARAKNYDAGQNEGLYTLQVTENSCKSEFSEAYDYKVTSVINQEVKLSIFPNPAEDMITIQFDSQAYSKLKISLCNTLMQELVKVYDSAGDTTTDAVLVDVSAYTQGLYFIKLESQSDTHYYKLLIVK
ncbi:MAG: T9SS type A sorting domain-containing protein [Candidatus Kapaibacterium sp.]